VFIAIATYKGDQMTFINKLIKTWPMHNLIAHPISEILYWVGLGNLGNRLHDATIPEHEHGTGRG